MLKLAWYVHFIHDLERNDGRKHGKTLNSVSNQVYWLTYMIILGCSCYFQLAATSANIALFQQWRLKFDFLSCGLVLEKFTLLLAFCLCKWIFALYELQKYFPAWLNKTLFHPKKSASKTLNWSMHLQRAHSSAKMQSQSRAWGSSLLA